ncbi:MAG TPA: serine hydrolase domain-containing protein [Caulobacteraceae bacterium]|nr:serine hydrolase domain-containing protein [Caulobacteraceae bacterium]
MALSVGLLSVRAQETAQTGPAATAASAQAPAPAPTPGRRYYRVHANAQAARAPAAVPPSLPPPAPGARLAPGAPVPAAELEAFVDGVVRQSMQQDHIPGVTVSVVQNGQVLLKKGYGFAAYRPRRPVDPDTTLFRLGELSSSFTWIAVMKEVERSHMRLDAPINLYLPEKLQVRDQGFTEPVRLRDLMDHASGFEERALGRLFERDPRQIRPLEVYLRQERPRRVRPPALRSEYTDYDAALAGEAVSQVTGQPFESLIEAEILHPLGMEHTSFREPHAAMPGLPAPMPASMAQGMAEGFRWTGLTLKARPMGYSGQIAPAASASSTAADMARFMMVLLAGGTLDGQSIYGPPTAQAQRTALHTAAPGLPGWTSGLLQQSLPGGIEGVGLDGSDLSFRADMTTAPALGLGIFVAGNSETADPLVRRLAALVVEHFYVGPPAGPAPSTVDPQTLKRIYAGHYLSEQRRYGGLEKFVDLVTRSAEVTADSNGLLVIRAPDGVGVWTPSGVPGHFISLAFQQPSAFEMQEGRAVRWFSPSGRKSFARVGWFEQPDAMALAAGASIIASLATLIGLFTRDRRDFRQTMVQQRASALQTTASVLWLVAALSAAAWGSGAMSDHAQTFFEWPGGFILIASACALVAALASVTQTLLLPAVWRGGRRLDSWTTGRKLAFTVTVAVYMTFSAILATCGALEPWNG